MSGMVEKTKHALVILQRNAVTASGEKSTQEAFLSDLKKHAEERINEFRRNAEDALTQVICELKNNNFIINKCQSLQLKRHALVEIQRALTAAELRYADLNIQDRARQDVLRPTVEFIEGDSTLHPSTSVAAQPTQQSRSPPIQILGTVSNYTLSL